MGYPLLNGVTEGLELVPVVKHISQGKVDAFAVASGGTGSIHVDPEFGLKTPFKSTLAHGFLLVCYMSEMMGNNFGPSWRTRGKLDVRFVAPAKPGDSVKVGGRVLGIQESERGEPVVSCEISVTNQRGEKLVAGEASIGLPVGVITKMS